MRSQSASRVSHGRSKNRPDSGSHPRASSAPILEEGCRVAGRFRIGGRTENRRDRQCYDAWDEAVERWVLLTVSRRPTVRDARLVHAGIGQHQEVGCIGDWFVSVLDPGAGESLGRLLGRLGPQTPLDLESWMIFGLGLCEALEHAGRFGLVHGDIGTRSIHVTPRFDPVLLGFPSRPNGSLSKASRPFASPERLLGHDPDARSDVYAVAALLYTLRAGEPPFGWDDDTSRDGHLYRLLEAHPRIPGRVMRELQRAMEKPARLRHSTVRELADALSTAYSAAADGWLVEQVSDFEDENTEEVALIEPTGFELSDFDAFDDLPTEVPQALEFDDEEVELELDSSFRPPIDPVWAGLDEDPAVGPDDLQLDDDSDEREPRAAIPSGHGLARRLAGPAASTKKPARGQPVARLHELVQGRVPLEPVQSMNDQTLELGPDLLDLDGDLTLELGTEYLDAAQTPPPQTGPRTHRPPVGMDVGASRGRSMPLSSRPSPAQASNRLADRAPSPGRPVTTPASRPLAAVSDPRPFEWEDTLDPRRPGVLTDPGAGFDAQLPAVALAAVCVLTVGLAGAVSVVAVLLAGVVAQ